VPVTLAAAELFGASRGAFTGADRERAGYFSRAQRGTLFLDEVGDIPLPLQVKLLRFLQERVIERIGGRSPIAVDTRIVCATHQDLDAMQAAGSFREDLYYRLAEIVVPIPSLADRSGDAVLLARHFTTRFARELQVKVDGLAPDAVEAIAAYRWPGNVRELENRIKRAVIMADGKLLGAADLDLRHSAEPLAINLRAAREVADRKAIHHALTRTDNNISSAAKLLGISRPTLYDLIKQYQLQA
jgi:two-component system NtrC family response regulator